MMSIIRAGNAAHVGEKANMKRHLSEARVHHRNHVADHELVNGRESAKQEHTRFNTYYDNVKSIHDGSNIPKAEDFDKSLNKALPKSPVDSKEIIPVVKPKGNPSYNYIHFDKLNPEQQISAKKKFMGRDMNAYHYPVDQGGSVIHAGRVETPPESFNAGTSADVKSASAGTGSPAPQANTGYVKPKVPHKIGDNVHINRAGHDLHGRVGKIIDPHPDYPHKIQVEVHRKTGTVGPGKQTMLLDSHEAKSHVPKKPTSPEMTKKSESGDVISLAKAALERLNKRG